MTPKAQFIFAPFLWWGHTRHQLQLSLNLLNLHPALIITLLTVPALYQPIQDEISAVVVHPGTSTDRLRVVTIDGAHEEDQGAEEPPEKLVKGFYAGLEGVLVAIVKGERVLCAIQGELEAVKAPLKFVMLDPFWSELISVLRKTLISLDPPVNPKTIPVYMGNPTAANWFISWWGPNGYMLDMRSRAEKLAKEKGVSVGEAYEDIVETPDHRVIDIPTVPKIFMYETRPQVGALPYRDPMVPEMLLGVTDCIKAADGVSTAMPQELELGCREKIMATGKDCVEVGPQYPAWFFEGKRAAWGKDHAVKEFLDRFEPGSVIYISFGSMFFPLRRIDILADLVTILTELNFPFIFSTLPPDAKIGDLVHQIDACGIGLIVKKAPQIALLQHPSVGYCLAHGGVSSFFECVLTEKPMVMWPLIADQVYNAAWACEYGVAIELIQVRTGESVGLPTWKGVIPVDDQTKRLQEMRDVFGDIRGAKGRAMKEKLKELKEITVKSWKTGSCRAEMEGFSRWID